MRTRQLEAQGAARFHGLLGEAVLAVWCDIDPEHDAEFNDWYTHQHLPERVGIPGFLRGRRWSVPKGAAYQKGGQYFTLYEIETLQTLVQRRTWSASTLPRTGPSERCRGSGTATVPPARSRLRRAKASVDTLRPWNSARPDTPHRRSEAGLPFRLCRRCLSITRWWVFISARRMSPSRGPKTRLRREQWQGLVALVPRWHGRFCWWSR
jgi:hypothetical protein